MTIKSKVKAGKRLQYVGIKTTKLSGGKNVQVLPKSTQFGTEPHTLVVDETVVPSNLRKWYGILNDV